MIDGKVIADELLTHLKKDVETLKKQGITPTLAVILIGENVGSQSYVRMKERTAQRIGATLRIEKYTIDVDKKTIQNKILALNHDPSVHGIIIQRPVPPEIRDEKLLNSIDPKKDVDGLVPHTHYNVPVALAVYAIVEKMFDVGHANKQKEFTIYGPTEFEQWVQNQHIVLIGRGETAGRPIHSFLAKKHCITSVISSQTSPEERKKLLKQADIIISCVGKKHMVTAGDIKKGSILLAVGIWRDALEKLHGDYDEQDISDTVAFHTTTPGGVGPVNVANLMKNLVTAASF